MGFLSKLFDPGKDARNESDQLARDAEVKGGAATGPGGISAGFNVGDDGRVSQSSSLGSFGPLLQQMQQLAGNSFGQAGAGLPPELQAIFRGAQQDLGTPNLNYSNFGQQQQGLSQLFGNSLGTATADPFALGQGVSDKLRALSERSNRNLVNSKFDQLKGSGRLGVSSGIAEAYELDANLRDQGMKFDLAGLQAGQGIQQNALGALFGASQGMSNINQQQFGQQLSGKQLLSQFANQRFGQAASMQQMRQQQEGQRFQQGMSAVSGASGLSQLPLAFQQALMQMQNMKSNVGLGAANNFMQSAANAKSPFLEALNAAGQFMGNVSGGGGDITVT